MDLQTIETAAKLRRRIFLTAYSGGMAHLASSFSAVEILYALYLRGVMNHDPHDPAKPDRDRFVLSKGHGALALYAVLCEAGYLTEDELFTYLKPNCHIGGEPNTRDIAGIEASTGSLGHGLSAGVGMALAQKLDRTGAKTYVLIGDGESQEGSIWEAAMSAAALSLDNLIVILDCNSLQKSSRVDDTMGYVHWDEKWRAFGWNVSECDGHAKRQADPCDRPHRKGKGCFSDGGESHLAFPDAKPEGASYIFARASAERSGFGGLICRVHAWAA